MLSITASIIMSLVCLVAPFLVIFAIPGLWIMVLSAWLMQVFAADLYSYWTLSIVSLLALTSDICDIALSAVFAGRAGGGKRSGLGAIAGAIIGAIVGTGILPVIGTLIGGAVGAAAGAVLLASTHKEISTQKLTKVGTSAAGGWLSAVAIKLTLGTLIAAILISGAWAAW